MYALQHLLEERIGNGVRRLPFGWGVVFPDIDFDVKSVEWPEDVVLDARKLRDLGVEKWLATLLSVLASEDAGRFRCACEARRRRDDCPAA